MTEPKDCARQGLSIWAKSKDYRLLMARLRQRSVPWPQLLSAVAAL